MEVYLQHGLRITRSSILWHFSTVQQERGRRSRRGCSSLRWREPPPRANAHLFSAVGGYWACWYCQNWYMNEWLIAWARRLPSCQGHMWPVGNASQQWVERFLDKGYIVKVIRMWECDIPVCLKSDICLKSLRIICPSLYSCSPRKAGESDSSHLSRLWWSSIRVGWWHAKIGVTYNIIYWTHRLLTLADVPGIKFVLDIVALFPQYFANWSPLSSKYSKPLWKPTNSIASELLASVTYRISLFDQYTHVNIILTVMKVVAFTWTISKWTISLVKSSWNK